MKKIFLPNSIGNTPIFKLPINFNSDIKIYAKPENRNLTGSIKDRAAYFMFEFAARTGAINKSKILIEPSSGNTAIALAAQSAANGYKFLAIFNQNVSLERIKLIKYYGAQVKIINGDNNIEIARKMIEENSDKYQMLDQYKNKMNYMAHYYTTAEEIIKDLPEITHLVAGIGTGGTLMGLSTRLKQYNKNIQIIGVEPAYNIKVHGLRNLTEFVPEIYTENKIDNHLIISDSDIAFNLSKEIGKKFGISAGPSSGASLWAALETVKHIKTGNVLVIFPDGIEKYLGGND